MSELSKIQQDMMGQELPEQTIIDGQPQEEAKPDATPTPEPTPDPETPETPEVDPITKVFKEEGLDKQFQTPEQAIRQWKAENQYRTRLEQENARLRAAIPPPPVPPKPEKVPVTGDDLYADPNVAIDRLGVAKREDVDRTNERLARIEADRRAEQAISFFNEHDELKDVAAAWRRGDAAFSGNDLYARMDEIYQSNPALQYMEPRTVLPLLYNAVRGERGVAPVTTAPPVDPKKKEAATTTSGKPVKPAGVKDASYFSKLSPAEIEKELGFTET